MHQSDNEIELPYFSSSKHCRRPPETSPRQLKSSLATLSLQWSVSLEGDVQWCVKTTSDCVKKVSLHDSSVSFLLFHSCVTSGDVFSLGHRKPVQRGYRVLKREQTDNLQRVEKREARSCQGS